MNIRAGTADDIPVMMQLIGHSATAAKWSLAHFAGMFDQSGPLRVALIVEDDATAKGFLVAHEVAKEWEIENIVVAPEERRRGLGTRLVGEFLDLVRSHRGTAVFLEVRESNRAARTLYETSGFQQTGRRSRYYAQPQEDAIVYRLTLT
jgi:[ribosomal protein S18]-alanine N-acetyltransferase